MAENTFRNTPKGQKKERKGIGNFQFPEISIEFLKDRRLHFILGIGLLAFSFFALIAFISYIVTGAADQSVVESLSEGGLYESGRQADNYFGGIGAWLSHLFIYKWFGISSFLFVPIFFLIGYKIVFNVELVDLKSNIRTLSFSVLWLSAFLGYFVFTTNISSRFSFVGGGIGYELALWMDSLMGWGSLILLAFILVVFLVFNFNFLGSMNEDGELMEEEEEENEEEELEEEPQEEVEEETVDTEEFDENRINVELRSEETLETEELATAETVVSETPLEPVTPVEPIVTPAEATTEHPMQEQPVSNEETSVEFDVTNVPVQKKEPTTNLEIEVVAEPEKVEIDTQGPEYDTGNDEVSSDSLYDPTLDLSKYQMPTIELLRDYGVNKVNVTKEELEANKDRIVNTLANYKIGIESIKATIGPTVTLYEIVPEAGIRISKIKNLEDDIALSLAALGIRIIAPIPGKGTIGIEVPNKKPEMVSMHSVVSSQDFQDVSKMDLPIVLGKTISNDVFVTDLAKMPHLLMAGATGQGKSVGLNCILTSLLYKKHPSQLKFVMVDPKKVELSLYNKIERHYLAMLPDSDEPIITDTSKVVNTLNSLCIEMDNRYELLKDAGCRNLKEYNQKFMERKLNPMNGHRFMPYIVLVIDELADLMMTAGKEVETPIARLAQLARAIGIHLIVATQRPSVNVITGIIKANFPARLSFRVTSKIDSRTILDAGGADQLIGKGDMLLSIGSSMVRIQCAFVDTPECDRICDFIRDQQGYSSAYMLPEYVGEDGGGAPDVDMDDRDAMFEDAARLIVRNQQGSTSLIQRKMKLGYNRAGRIMDQLEASGVVGPSQGSKAREVLIPDEYSLEQLLTSLNSND